MLNESEIERIRAQAGLVSGLNAEEVFRRLEEAVRGVDLAARQIALDLAKMADHPDADDTSTLAFAVEHLGLDACEARERIELGRRLPDLPLADASFRQGDISWSELLLLARIATSETEAAWLQRAVETDVEQLAKEVQRTRPGEPPLEPDGI